MSTSMHVCTFCGKCRPPKEPKLICKHCGTWNDPELGEYGTCKECGGKLPERTLPEPIFCLKIEQMCARPCQNGRVKPRVKAKMCRWHTPVED